MSMKHESRESVGFNDFIQGWSTAIAKQLSSKCIRYVNRLKARGYYMHQQF
jgi:hypothetical protein